MTLTRHDPEGVSTGPAGLPHASLADKECGAIGLNVLAGDQPVADVIHARTFSPSFKRQGYRPETSSWIVESNGTVTSVLISRNTCGTYHSEVLGVATFDYFPYCFFSSD